MTTGGGSTTTTTTPTGDVLAAHFLRIGDLTPDGAPSSTDWKATASIGGVLDTEEIVAELAELAGSFDPSLCPPSATFQSIANQIRQVSDILAGGTQDPVATCDGISIGFGFDAEAARLGAVFDPPVTPDPCNP